VPRETKSKEGRFSAWINELLKQIRQIDDLLAEEGWLEGSWGRL